jgi:DNA repair ATPase RecN
VIPLRIESIALRGVRNLERVDLLPGPRFNVVSGDNGQGKTSLLEAIYLVMTTRSFRTAKLRDVVAHGRTVASVRARVVEGDQEREQSVGIEGATRSSSCLLRSAGPDDSTISPGWKTTTGEPTAYAERLGGRLPDSITCRVAPSMPTL